MGHLRLLSTLKKLWDFYFEHRDIKLVDEKIL
jgi:hypothetical protein